MLIVRLLFGILALNLCQGETERIFAKFYNRVSGGREEVCPDLLS